MPQQPPQNDTLHTSANARPGLFWAVDSNYVAPVDSSCCRLKDVYGIDSLLYPGEFVFSDSLSASDSSSIQYRTSVIGKKPFAKELQDEPYKPVDNFYLSLFIVVGFFASGTISYGNRKSFSMLLKSTVSPRSMPEIMRDRTHITGVFFTAPFMLAVLLNGIFIGYTMRASNIFSLPGALDVLLFCAATITIQLFKNILLKAIGTVFEMHEKTEQHILFNHQFFCISSWIYVPTLALALAIPVDNVQFFHIFLIVNILLSALYTTTRLFVNFSYNGLSSIGLFILYICSTEVLPVLLFLKTIYLIKDF